MKRHSWVVVQIPHVLECLFLELVDVLGGVLILHGLDVEVNAIVGVVALVETVIFGDAALNLLPQGHSCLVQPAPGYIVNRVTSSS